ncbi:hypothetical protein FQN55_008836 [Onygenales sp. PD_40]|nr:hypothetical protein FQN55_008836 [Onygenales sp. PD_40]KAK2781922.1 hypothetical protein FQN53_000265 [Emmonsiellopsis sp. PD_33]KAK2794868.1 hypothetical protein FQN51_000611 [Onygenales sp. PD_10]
MHSKYLIALALSSIALAVNDNAQIINLGDGEAYTLDQTKSWPHHTKETGYPGYPIYSTEEPSYPVGTSTDCPPEETSPPPYKTTGYPPHETSTPPGYPTPPPTHETSPPTLPPYTPSLTISVSRNITQTGYNPPPQHTTPPYEEINGASRLAGSWATGFVGVIGAMYLAAAL